MSGKEPTTLELVALLNEQGIEVWDATVVINTKTGDVLGHKKYGECSSAHAEMGPDGNVMFVVGPDEEEIDPKKLN